VANTFKNKTDEEVQAKIRQIVSLIFDGKIVEEIKRKEEMDNRTICKYLNHLIDPNYTYKDPEFYKEIKAQQDKNTRKRKSQSSKEIHEQKLSHLENIANEIIEGKISPEEASKKYHQSLTNLLNYLRHISNPTKKKKLEPILSNYPTFFTTPNVTSKPVLQSCSENLKKEIILMALTYRVSYQTLAKIFSTTIQDVIEAFKFFEDLVEVIEYLDFETRNESLNLCEYAEKQALSYWKERNRLKKELQTAEQNGERFLIKIIQRDQVKHQRKIDDVIVYNCIGKKWEELTIEEKNRIAWYRVKYGLGMVKCAEILRFDIEFLKENEERYANENEIFREKINLLNDKKTEERAKLIADRKVLETEKNIQSIFALKSAPDLDYFHVNVSKNLALEDTKKKEPNKNLDFPLKQPINLEYFNFTISKDTSLEDIENQTTSRGGGTR